MGKSIFKIFMLSTFLVSACNIPNHYMLTQVYPDGSCYRKFETTINNHADPPFITGDTSFNPFPVWLDIHWKISWSYGFHKYQPPQSWPVKRWVLKKDSTKRLFVFAQKIYTSPEQLSQPFSFNKSSWKIVNQKVIAKKKFQWFFTFYTYQVVFKELNTLKRIPVSRYVTNEELRYFTGENPNFVAGKNSAAMQKVKDAIEKKIYDQWLCRSVFEEYYSVLLRNIAPVDSNKVIKAKDSIYQEAIRIIDDLEPEKFVEILKGHFNTSLLNQLNASKKFTNEIDSIKTNLQSKAIGPFAETFTFDLLMPGKLISTNAKIIKSDTLRWEVDAYKFFFNDYTLSAEYRATNPWAFWVSGGLVLLLALVFFWKKELS